VARHSIAPSAAARCHAGYAVVRRRPSILRTGVRCGRGDVGGTDRDALPEFAAPRDLHRPAQRPGSPILPERLLRDELQK
jgi:hypothetical protein